MQSNLAKQSAVSLAKQSVGLGKQSTGLAKGSVGLDKASIISIAKRSIYGDKADAVVEIDETPWHAIPDTAFVLSELVSSASEGLTSAEAARRLQDYGPNRLTPPPKPGFLQKLWAQLNSSVIFILFAAAIIKGALQSWPAFGLVLLVIVVNTAIGLLQEGKAEKAAEAIKAMLSSNAVVVRDGERKQIPAEDLVPGDIVVIKSGDKIPADVRLIQTANLQVQEAMLTGESVPASKHLAAAAAEASLGDRKCMCYSATAVVSGQAQGVVVATGDSAEIGLINRMVGTVDSTRNNLMVQLEVLGRWLAVLVLIMALVAFLLSLLVVGNPFAEAFSSAVAIAVAIIPEGLPAMVTVVLALGTTVMAKNNAIIRQLPCVETLGSLTVICSDKTGTLTKNEMTAVRLRTAANLFKVTGVGYAPQGTFTTDADAPLTDSQMGGVKEMLAGLLLCNDSTLTKSVDKSTGKEVYTPMGAPTEVALITVSQKAGLSLSTLSQATPRIGSVPFESEHKFMATVHQEVDGKRLLLVKGAPDRLMPMCTRQVAGDSLTNTEPFDREFWTKAQAELSSQGLRVLALCRGELGPEEDATKLTPAAILGRRDLTLVLMVAILDPPRSEAISAIEVAHKAGITVKMITGDHSLTALAIAKMLGIAASGMVITGPEIDRMNDEALTAVVMECNVYARASPENKLRIVRALQDRDQVVAMTGDGVNDAPALKAADVGVAMGITGTDVSKEAAKMVLADDNFASIVAAVKEGRRVWDNIRKILIFNLPVNLAQGCVIMYSYIVGLKTTPLTALQVLLVNLVTSITLGLALAAEPAEPSVMTRPPRRPGKRLVGKLLLWRMFFVAHIIVVLVIAMFYWGGLSGLLLTQQRAEAFNVLVGAQVAYFICNRFIKASTFHPRVLHGNKVAYASVLITLSLMVFFTLTPGVNTFFDMSPMEGYQWGRVAVCMVAVYAIVEVEKALVDPLFMPLLRPVFRFVEDHTPAWLSLKAAYPKNWLKTWRKKKAAAEQEAAHAHAVQPRGVSRTHMQELQQKLQRSSATGVGSSKSPGGSPKKGIRAVALDTISTGSSASSSARKAGGMSTPSGPPPSRALLSIPSAAAEELQAALPHGQQLGPVGANSAGQRMVGWQQVEVVAAGADGAPTSNQV